MTNATSITVRVPLKIRRRPGRKTVVMPVATAGTAIPTRADPALVKALARGFRYQRLLDEGRYASISEMAAGERIERSYLGCLMRLTLLAPPIIEAILNGRQPDTITLPGLMEGVPAAWAKQQCTLERGAQSEPGLAEPTDRFGRVGFIPQASGHAVRTAHDPADKAGG